MRDQLANDAESDHGHDVAQLEASDAHGIQRDAAERRERRLLQGDCLWNSRDELASSKYELAVPRALAPIRDTVAGKKIRDRGMYRLDVSRSTVAENTELLQLVAYLVGSPHDAVGVHRLENHFQPPGIGGGFAEQTLRMNRRGLGTAADQ